MSKKEIQRKNIHNFGLDNIDLESRLVDGSSTVNNGRLEFPVDSLLVVHDLDGSVYYAEIEPRQKNVEDAGANISLKLDEKYNLKSSLLSERPQGDYVSTIDVIVQEKSGGGGAHNAAFGQAVFLRGHILAKTNGSIEEQEFGDVYNVNSYLHVMYGSSFIRNSLPMSVRYRAICGIDDDNAGKNIILSIGGRKITLRSKSHDYDDADAKRRMESSINQGDTLFVNTVKDVSYLGQVYEALDSGKVGKMIVTATDSMIAALGVDEVTRLVSHSDVYISNVDELKMMAGIEISDPGSLVQAMDYIRDVQTHGKENGKKPHIYVTFGDAGAAVMDTSGNIFYQSCIDFPIETPFGKRVINTNGCGDAFAGAVATLETADFPTLEILDYASAVGHICSQEIKAVSKDQSPQGVAEFRQKYGNRLIKTYDRPQQDFIGGIEVNCRFDYR